MSYTARKQSQNLDILGNVETWPEILARMRPGKMASGKMVALQKQMYAKSIIFYRCKSIMRNSECFITLDNYEYNVYIILWIGLLSS